MFDRHSKTGAHGDAGRGGAAWIGDLSGAFADLGTFLPLVIGILIVGSFDPTGLLVGFGLFAIATGLVYRLPVPVQPMKAVAALAIAGGLGADAMAAAGLMLGLALLILGASGLIDRMHRLVPRTVLIGIQLGLGLHLLIASAGLAGDAVALGLAAFALLILLQATPFRTSACLALLVAGVAWSGFSGGALPSASITLDLPAIAFPSWNGIALAAETVFWPQLALTVANAVLLTSVLAAEYFPKAGDRASARRLALSSGALNLALAPIGAMPMCHGAGGLAAQYHQGARTGLAPVVFGGACLLLGLFAGAKAIDWLLLVPLPVVAALLAFAGVQLVQPARLFQVSKVCLLVIALTALVSLLVNIAAGLVAGLVAELVRSVATRRSRPTT